MSWNRLFGSVSRLGGGGGPEASGMFVQQVKPYIPVQSHLRATILSPSDRSLASCTNENSPYIEDFFIWKVLLIEIQGMKDGGNSCLGSSCTPPPTSIHLSDETGATTLHYKMTIINIIFLFTSTSLNIPPPPRLSHHGKLPTLGRVCESNTRLGPCSNSSLPLDRQV